MTGIYKIADRVVEIISVYNDVHDLCTEYISDETPEFSVMTNQENIDFERKKSADDDIAEGRIIRNFSDGYLETLMKTSGVSFESVEALNELDSVIATTSLEMQSLAATYDIAYAAAKTSFEGQFSLFDTATADASATVTNMQNALNSQLNFWQTYADNVNILRGVSAEDLGVTQENYNEIMAYAQSGTEEAAGFAASLAQAVNSGNTEAIATLANTVGEVKAAREQAAGEVAAWQVDFDGQMQKIISTMETSLQEMDMSEEAIAAAKSTMTSYADTISTQGAFAVANAVSIANQVREALQSASTTINIGVSGGGTTGTGYASGTDFATPGWHLVGENGPEIVEFGGGETVYPADETARMLANYRPTPLNTNVPESLTGQKTQDVSTRDKRIVVAIEGGGEITVNGNVDKDAVVELLIANLKPALLSVLQEEVFEEGDGSYEY